MGKIKILPPEEAQKITAGEVVERPANVLKELLENSIDAGASDISVYVEAGGKKSLRVVDNGCGMSKDDALLCLENHATSKLQNFDLLYSISTYGFRGEALPSISAVSRLKITTRTKETDLGTEIVREFGGKPTAKQRACNIGTEVAIEELFGNIPVRLKFLKADERELRHITAVFQAAALSKPEIRFRLFSGTTMLQNCPSATSLRERYIQINGFEMEPHLLDLEVETSPPGTELHGLITDHQLYRYNRSSITIFVNGRVVRNIKLISAFIKGYSGVLPPNKFPAGVLKLEIDPDQVDVNIHPKKEEVSLAKSYQIELAIKKAIDQTLNKNIDRHIAIQKERGAAHINLSGGGLYKTHGTCHGVHSQAQITDSTNDRFYQTEQPAPNTGLSRPFQPELDAPQPDLQSAFSTHQEERLQAAPNSSIKTNLRPTELNASNKAANRSLPYTLEMADPSDNKLQSGIANEYAVLGQAMSTYIVVSRDDGIVIFDQHAAHERIIYNRMAANFEKAESEQLLFPEVVKLGSEEFSIISKATKLLTKFGIEVEEFGEQQIRIRSVPVDIKRVNLGDLIKKIASILAKNDGFYEELEIRKELHEKIHAQMACKAAVKAGDTLSMQQMTEILNQLEKETHKLTCPHGRPTMWKLTKQEVEKRFKRVV